MIGQCPVSNFLSCNERYLLLNPLQNPQFASFITKSFVFQLIRFRNVDSISLIPSPKRQKFHPSQQPISCSDDKEDRISKLPDAILGHILSLLPVRVAERTGALSTSWKTLWALLPDLVLEMPRSNLLLINLESQEAFINFVEKILILRNGLPIRKFRLSCWLRTIDCFGRVYNVICTAINCHVARLDLCFLNAFGKVRLPWNPLMKSKTLVKLKLGHHFVIDVPIDVSFPSLKRLHLNSLLYSDDYSLERLICGCPVLEKLSIRRLVFPTDNVTRLNVSVPSLKRLKIVSAYPGKYKHELRVDAPNLEYLYLFDQLSENYRFKYLSSIVEAYLDIIKKEFMRQDALHGDQVFGLLRSIFSVKTLCLSESTMRTLGCAENKVLPTFPNLVHLSLGIDNAYGWLLLPSFLERMPNLEVLIFPNGLVPYGHWRADSRKYETFKFKFNWYAPEAVPACFLLTLHTIEIHNDGPLTKKELNLIEYLLANAMCLRTKKMCRGKMDGKTRKKLTSYNRGSDSCQIVLL